MSSPEAAQELHAAAQEQPTSTPGEAQRPPSTYIWPEAGGPKVKKRRFGSSWSTIVGQRHTVIDSKSVVWCTNVHTFGHPLPGGNLRGVAGRKGGCPKVKQLRLGTIMAQIVDQQHTVIDSKSEFLDKF